MNEYWSIILTTWTLEEIEGWVTYADAVETGKVGMHWPVG